MDVEAAAMQVVNRISPAHTPSLELYDPATHTLAMQYMEGHVNLQDAILAGMHVPWALRHVAQLMAAYMHATSSAALGEPAVAAEAARFANSDIVAANVAVVFDDPWDAACTRNRWSAELDAQVVAARCAGRLSAHSS